MDKSSAVLEATKRNMQIGDIIKARHAGSQLENGIPKIKRGYVDELGLFERCTIVNTARGITPISGIYFLVHNAEIVYIGQSRDVLLRLSTHVREDKKIFTSFAVVEAPPEKLDDLEAKYIAKFAPILNIQRPVLVIISSPILG